ncbi:hypothetical protein WMF31_12500 [Sorangium sp. So ce1036]|uniref:hypothetical protein n=1 Tax=Sorangium sp. So ce1036 TaxID=3133328 RepID=UPI003EFCBB18
MASLAALAWASACGGNVVVDGLPDGAEYGATGTGAGIPTSGTGIGTTGAGGAGGGTGTAVTSAGVGSSSASSTTTTSSAIAATTGAGGGDPRSMCQSFCELTSSTCGGDAGDCARAFCEPLLSRAQGCDEQLVRYIDCSMANVRRCDLHTPECEDVAREFWRCAASSACPGLECVGNSDRACNCKGSCGGVELLALCGPGRRPDTVLCDCIIDGVSGAICEDSGPACDLAHGCCEPLFERFR